MTAKRVALVVTGKLEFIGLAGALKKLFPTVEFTISPTLDSQQLKSATSCAVDPTRNARAMEEDPDKIPVIDELIGDLAGNLCGRRSADVAILVDDLELENRGNEHNVVKAVHDAVHRHIARVAKLRHAPRDLPALLRDRASFHLFDPMIETYFFADPNALGNAAIGGLTHSSLHIDNGNPERFLVCHCREPAYFDTLGECARGRGPKERKCPWHGDKRFAHPKKYLSYLCRDTPPNDFCTRYSETGSYDGQQSFGGARVLGDLDWSKVLRCEAAAPFLRALVEDLQDALSCAPQLPNWPAAPTSKAITSLTNSTPLRVLRNL